MRYQLVCMGCIKVKECKRSLETVIDCLDIRLNDLKNCETDIESINNEIKGLDIALKVIARKLGIDLEFEVSCIRKKGR